MAEPTSSTIAGAVVGAGVSLPMILLGAQLDSLVIGLVAAVFMSIWLPSIDDRMKSFSAVVMSSLLAGYGSPVAPPYVVSWVPSLSPVADHLRLLLALVIGALAPILVPILVDRLKGWTGRQL